MSITKKATVALVAIFLALFAGAWIALEAAVRPGFARQEAVTHADTLERLQANLAEVSRDVASRVRDYAHWDDTYAYVSGANPSYIADNFAEDWLADYGAHFVAFTDSRGRLLWTSSLDANGQPIEDPALARQVIAEAEALAPADASSASGVVWTERGPLMFGAARSTRSDESGAPRGLVVIGRRLDDAAIYQQLQLNLRFIPVTNADPALRGGLAALSDHNVFSWRDPGTIYSMLALRNGDHLVGAVLASQERAIAALGQSTIMSALMMLTAMFICILVAFWLLLKRGVTERLAAIKQHFLAEGAEATPLPADGARDEISQLTEAYNALLVRLREAVAGEERALHESQAAMTANRLKSDFLANISHELRTPLNAIVGYAELIDEDLADQGFEAGRKDLAHVTEAARHLLTLINEILDLSRMEGDRLELRPEAFRVDEMLNLVVGAATPLAAAQASVLRIEFDNDLGVGYTDHIRLRQCLVNVLAHACKRSHAAAVTLRARRERSETQDMLCFDVIDLGPTLSEAQLLTLFEPYVQLDDIPGAGARLGLAVTRKMLSLMGGSIDASANLRGRGCHFSVVVPAEMLETPQTKGRAAA